MDRNGPVQKERKKQMNTKNGSITPSKVTHYSNVLDTSWIKSQEVLENITRDGAGTDIQCALEQVTLALQNARDVLSRTKEARAQEMEEERSTKRTAREAEMATRKALRLATKAATVSIPRATQDAPSGESDTLDGGPEGPLALGHGTYQNVPGSSTGDPGTSLFPSFWE